MAAEGDLIAGRYRLAAKVGRGGMGVVWRAHDEVLGRIVAVKQLLVGVDMSEGPIEGSTTGGSTVGAAERAMREGRIAARLQHPNAIVVHDVVVHDSRPCLVMEYLPSKSLAAVVRSRGPLPVKQVVRIGRQIASALAAAHVAGIVHRDVKPENVLIGSDGTVKITDFGLSRAIGEGTMTDTGMIAGTPGFLAPEVVGGAEAGYPSDVFSLGATLYNAIEGAPPFGDHHNKFVLLVRAARDEVTPPRRAGAFEPMLMSLLARDPGKRPTMQQIHEALLTGREPSAERAEEPAKQVPHEQPRTRRRPRRLFSGIVAAALVSLSVVFAVVLASGGGTANPAAAANPPTVSNRLLPVVACQSRTAVKALRQGSYQAGVEVRKQDGLPKEGLRITIVLPGKHVIKDVSGGAPRQYQDGHTTVLEVIFVNVDPARSVLSFTFTASGDERSAARQKVSCGSP